MDRSESSRLDQLKDVTIELKSGMQRERTAYDDGEGVYRKEDGQVLVRVVEWDRRQPGPQPQPKWKAVADVDDLDFEEDFDEAISVSDWLGSDSRDDENTGE